MDEIHQPFARVTMAGDSFEGGHLPIRSLEELRRYQDLVIQAAKLLWKDGHPESELPEGFEQAFELSLAAIEQGSAISILERPGISDFDDYYSAGRDELERELSTILSADPDPYPDFDRLPLLEIPEFQTFGSSLRPHEEIVITRSRVTEKEVVITRETSQYVIKPLADEYRKWKSARYSEIGWIVGRLVAIDADRSSFTINSIDHGRVNGRYKDSEILADLKAVLGSSAKAPVMRMRANLRFAREKLDRVLDVQAVELLEIDGEPWSRRLIELASLQDGWHEESPDSKSIAFSALDGARDVLRFARDKAIPTPGLFPMDDGSVNIEWASPSYVISIEIDPELEFSIYETGSERKTTDIATSDISDVFTFLAGVSFE
ncbi:hypothetical protein ACFWPK_13375 [Nocardia sp. NPDC058519]|uniref:hypothetical protein n=1 Tax=Nocardia sp. NPDC058519 TaxID=3346535 RepID=UPI00366537F8